MGFLRRIIRTLIRERNIEESSSATLPDVVLDKIFANLSITDRVRLSRVCKSWRSALTRSICSGRSEEDPWLIMSVEYNTSPEIRLKSSSEENRSYRFKLPESKHSYWCCCGSCDGWLLIAFGRDLRSVDLILWNPLSGETKNLPPLSTLSFSDRFAECWDMTVSNIVRCARVASRDGCTLVSVVLSIPLAGGKEQLALCTTCDRAWRPVGSVKTYYFYEDICFRRGKLYAVSSHAESETTKYRVRFECDNACEVVVLRIRDEVAPLIAQGDELLRPSSGIGFWERCFAISHLVECSVTGDLLAVTAVMDLFSYRAASSTNTAAAPVTDFCCTRTRGFEIHRLSLSDDDDCYIGFLDGGAVGDQGVFVGHMGTVSLRDGVKGNRISFATKDSRLWTPDREGRVHSGEIAQERYSGVLEQGVYDVRRGRIETQSTINVDFLSDSSSIGWFTPHLI